MKTKTVELTEKEVELVKDSTRTAIDRIDFGLHNNKIEQKQREEYINDLRALENVQKKLKE